MNNRYHIGAFAVLLGGSCLGLSGVFLRHIDQADGWSILFYRSGTFFLTLLAVLAFQYRGGLYRAFTAIGKKGLAAALLLSIGNICYIFAMLNTTVANVVFIIGSAPLFTALLAWIFLKEAVTGLSLVAMMIAMLGIGLMFADGLVTGGWFGNLLALFMVLMYALYLLMLRGSQNVDMIPATCLSGLVTAIIVIPMMTSEIGSGFAISKDDLIICMLLGTVQFGLGFYCITIGARYIPAAEVALFSLSESILNPVLVWIFVGEVPSTFTIYGSLLVLISVVTYSIIAIRRERQQATSTHST